VDKYKLLSDELKDLKSSVEKLNDDVRYKELKFLIDELEKEMKEMKNNSNSFKEEVSLKFSAIVRSSDKSEVTLKFIEDAVLDLTVETKAARKERSEDLKKTVWTLFGFFVTIATGLTVFIITRGIF
jgi:hypothetical protein